MRGTVPLRRLPLILGGITTPTAIPMSERLDASLPRHPIRVVSRRTGLTEFTLRAWERRYGATQPSRTEKGRRLYSDADVERLLLLRQVTESGHSIGEIASLSDEQLTTLLQEDQAAQLRSPAETQVQSEAGEAHVSACFEALERLDGARIQAVLTRAAVELGPARFIDLVVIPFLQRIGGLWEQGTLRPGHEHLASVAMRQVLGWLLETFQPANGAPTLVATTPAGQRHEFGAMLAAAIAATAGWRTVYLGPDLPAEEIAVIAREVDAQAVALSVMYPNENIMVADELRRLHGLLPAGTSVLVGGRAAHLYQRQLEGNGAEVIPDLRSLQERLRLS